MSHALQRFFGLRGRQAVLFGAAAVVTACDQIFTVHSNVRVVVAPDDSDAIVEIVSVLLPNAVGPGLVKLEFPA